MPRDIDEFLALIPYHSRANLRCAAGEAKGFDPDQPVAFEGYADALNRAESQAHQFAMRAKPEV
jgi:hypothetical protein